MTSQVVATSSLENVNESKLLSRVKELEEVLRFYASSENWIYDKVRMRDGLPDEVNAVILDGGKKAKEVLEKEIKDEVLHAKIAD